MSKLSTTSLTIALKIILKKREPDPLLIRLYINGDGKRMKMAKLIEIIALILWFIGELLRIILTV